MMMIVVWQTYKRSDSGFPKILRYKLGREQTRKKQFRGVQFTRFSEYKFGTRY
jgi:hypothetical protein